MVLFTIFVCISLVSCSGSDEDSLFETNYCLEIQLDEKTILLPGETIHVKDDSRHKRFSIKGENDELESTLYTRNLGMDFYGPITGELGYHYKNGKLEFLNPGICKLVLTDYDTNETYSFNIVIDEIDVKEVLEIGGTISDILDNDGNIQRKGPLLELITIGGGSKTFYTSERFKIQSFGSNKETCYPSSADRYWANTMKLNPDGTLSSINFRSYLGKVSITKEIEYWFYKFTYGNTTHEVRKYIGSKKCLWDGEWKK